MPWLETIRVLTATTDVAGIAARTARLAAELEAQEPDCRITVHTSRENPADLLVCLHWQARTLAVPSRTGLGLAEYLTQLGLVDHAVWPQVAPAAARPVTRAPGRQRP